MFWLIENSKQFEVLKNSGFKEAFVEIIPNNPYQHPTQNSICAFYVRPIKGHKGYIYLFLIWKYQKIYMKTRFTYG